MRPFITHTGHAAALLRPNIDTDLIIPKQFLKTLKRTGLGAHLFHEWRYDPEGKEISEFILNQPRGRAATILLAGSNFGCGSSREHASWALRDFGFRAVLAPSFADIFFNNCFQNGILPACVAQATLAELAPLDAPLTVDLPTQTVTCAAGVVRFDIEPARKRALLLGLDGIASTERHLAAITRYEARRAAEAPWAVPPASGRIGVHARDRADLDSKA
jgi:3-isopropylmalate/(R)-2-methylmalate dehydratase small subunit